MAQPQVDGAEGAQPTAPAAQLAALARAQQQLERLFDSIDKDGNGVLDAEELAGVASSIGMPSGESGPAELLQRLAAVHHPLAEGVRGDEGR